jgi:eukaryotic-like serine/threonine-protein kinase
MASRERPLMPNIGKYEIESRIGHGGMGDVYRAFDPTLRRRVAIKVLKVEGDTENLNRFRLEATSAGNLNHPNIVTIHDYGDFEGEPYIVMEYLEGEDLQRTIDSGKKFDLVEITGIMSQVADALECAHQAGVIHRDVKPANIMLPSRGGSQQNVKLMDFGIARLAGANTQQTKVGHLIGTVLYMSPEQFHNLELDRRVDIWAYGVIYYQLLAGKHPFAVSDQIVTMYNIANKPAPPICSINPDVPEALGQIVDRCLSKDRDQRYATMEDLRFDVMPVLQDLSRQQAARMLGEARKLIDNSDWDAAQTIIKRVLELDPADRTAVALRRTVADALRKRETAPRISNLVAAAEQHIAEKQYQKALETLDTALKIDPGAEDVRKRGVEVRELLERERRAQELLHAARQDMATEHFTGAYQHATEALRYDPGHVEAAQLLASVRDEMARRERQKRVRDGLDKARQLLGGGSYDEAIKLLQELLEFYPGTLEASQLLREAESIREMELRNRRLRDSLTAVKEFLRLQRFSDAVQRLETLSTEFPGEEEVLRMLHYAREEWKVRQRVEALDRIKAGIAQLRGEGRFDEALRLVERSQLEFPKEPELLRLGQAVSAAKAEAERRAALDRVLLDAQAKRQNGELTEAIKLIDLGLEQHGPDERLLGVREQLERDWQTAQRNQALHRVLQEGRQFFNRKEWDKAIPHFQQVVKQYPEEVEPRELLAAAEATRAQERKERAEREAWEKKEKADREAREQKERAEREAGERRRQIEQTALAKAVELEGRNQREAAVAEIETALRQYSDSAPLLEAKARLQREIAEAKKTQERELKLFEARRKADEEQKRRAQELEDKANEQRRTLAAKVEDALAKAYLAIGQGDLAKAGKMIAEAGKIDASHPGLPRAQADLQAAQNLATQQVAARPVEQAKPFPVKAIGIGAGAAVAALVGAFLLLHKPPAPTLDVSPRSANLSAAPASISLTGTGPFQAKPSDPWINVDPDSGTLPSTVVLSAKPGNLAAGTYTGSVEISSGELNKPIAVSLTIEARKPPPPPPVEKDPNTEVVKPPSAAQAEISLSPESLNVTYQAGTPEPAPRSIYADGKGKFEASVRNGQWVSISPAAGNLPGPLSVAIHPGQLPPGSYATQIVVSSVDSPAAKKFANIHLTVTEAAKPVVVKPPVDPPVTPPPPPVEPQKCSSVGYFGRLLGDLVWNGNLPPNGKVVIGPSSVTQGTVAAVGSYIPRMACFDVSNLSPGVRASTAASTLTLTNTSGAPINSISVHWAVK